MKFPSSSTRATTQPWSSAPTFNGKTNCSRAYAEGNTSIRGCSLRKLFVQAKLTSGRLISPLLLVTQRRWARQEGSRVHPNARKPRALRTPAVREPWVKEKTVSSPGGATQFELSRGTICVAPPALVILYHLSQR